MNQARRKKVAEIVCNLEKILKDIDTILLEEEDYRDNMPENLQQSSRYEETEENCQNLQEASSAIDDTISYLDSIDGVSPIVREIKLLKAKQKAKEIKERLKKC